MLKTRLIPVLLLKNGILVRSKSFSFHQTTGDAIGQVERYSAWKADELIYLNISRDGGHDYRKNMQVIGSTSSKKDLAATTANSFKDVIFQVAKKCTIPLTAGGGIRNLTDISILLANGADKVSINTQAIADPSFIERAAKKFGSQSIVVCVDVKREEDGPWVYTQFGKEKTGMRPEEWCREVEKRGAGEILLQSIDRDGTGTGYDLELIRSISDNASIPVIALGGVGDFDHFVKGVQIGHASAVAAANIFHFTEHSILHAKEQMKDAHIEVRL